MNLASPRKSKSPLPARLARRLVSPQLFDFWATRLNPLWTLEQPVARLVQRIPASRDAVTLVLQPNGHWRGLQAGQHVSLGVEIDGRRLLRSYSPTVLADGRLAITVKAIEGGLVSRFLARDAALGTVVSLAPAFGDMLLPTTPTPLLLLAAGSGITPMRALLQAAAQAGMPMDVDLLYWVRQRDEACFVDEFAALAAAHPRLRVQLLTTREGETPAERVDTYSLDQIAALDQRHVMACGPGGFVQAARERLQGRVAAFQAEAFSVPALDEAETGQVQVQLSRSGRTLTLPRGQSLLEGLEAQGLRPKHGCRMGICNTCACPRQSGTTRHLLTGERSNEPTAQVRLCISAPSTDLILDL
ncbi:ferredoxin reductase [Xanthomonas citri pv. citri]|uniref:Oxidoreductase n=9 Tax=Xanthomonas TaxID=338 RepID=A0AAI8EUH1_XANAC|nr:MULTISPECIES: ferredoxin reductase [Xanthomonas]AAM38797.1 oxidoreductase [Xanthomonas citri pv. citri str. 306]AGH79388.1 oxidoreductase [Xanthomonas axonopodis Xac29-1]AGI06165.1 Flavodoxin reductases (ferredoxin-NADPH reductases) family 1 [Xanthomonas citri subsp. citri Aw12879]AJD70537.1 flavodoxin reductase family protein [Xanthomonas citri subsp. citri A306]AJY84023.1 Flavodoxin reductases (ferredoxin-NADPH reductases) family 1 [Xanthomonas citri pv. citri]